MLQHIKKVFFKESSDRYRPVVSFVVIVYDMPAQAQKTIMSLGIDYQQGVQSNEFEVIIVENESPNLMDEKFVQSLPSNVSYHLRKETATTPVHAINFGASVARGQNICLMIDGARMLTPGVVRNILMGHRMCGQAAVSIPGYHLGDALQQESVNAGYGLAAEQELLRSIDWPKDGYRLFDIACFSGTSSGGYFLPSGESNCISVPREVWHELGGCDVRFNLRGGGFINLDLYKRVCDFPGLVHVVVPGEGSFHQFHGGVTTGGEEKEVRAKYVAQSREQYREIRGEKYSRSITNPVYLGQIPEQAMAFMHYSSDRWLKVKGKKPL